MRVNISVMMHQGKHSLGRLIREGSFARPQAMLILLLCHSQGYPLCSNAPTFGNCFHTRAQAEQARDAMKELLSNFHKDVSLSRFMV